MARNRFSIFFPALLCLVACLVGAFPVQAAFEKANKGLPGIMLGEVSGYGENTLRKEYFSTFEELLLEKLQKSNKFSVRFKTAASLMSPDDAALGQESIFSELHKYAIVSGRNFDKDQACIELVRYCENHAHEPGTSEVYRLRSELKGKAQDIGNLSDARYIVFCNLKNVDIKLKNHHITPYFEDLKGMKIVAEIDYYLLDTALGVIYEGYSFTDKTTQVFNLLMARYGKNFDVQQLVQCILETLAERVVEDISGKGLGKVKNYA